MQHADGQAPRLASRQSGAPETHTNPGLPTETRGLRWVELRGYVSNSCRFAITFCWWLWQREAYSFPLIHEQNQKALYKCGEINEFVIKYFLPRIEPTRGGAAADLV